MKKTGANATVIFVPPPFAADAILEAIDADIPLIVAITEGIPVLDMVKVKRALEGSKSRLDRPQLPRRHHARRVQDRHHAGLYPQARQVGIVSRSGTLTYEAVHQTTWRALGKPPAIGIGGDPVKGTEHIDILEMLLADDETQSIVMIGEIGGSAEEEAAAFYKSSPPRNRW